MNGTAKCPICGRPYKWYSHYAGDQSACPKCRAEAESIKWVPAPKWPRPDRYYFPHNKPLMEARP